MKKYLPVILLLFSFFTWNANPCLGAETTDKNFQAGLNFFQEKQYIQAIDSFKTAIKLDPGNWTAYVYLGNCYYFTHRGPEAVAAYDRALALHPDPKLQGFADSIRKATPNPGSSASPPSINPAISGMTDADSALNQFNDGVSLQAESQETLRQYGLTHTLTREQKNVADFGMAHFARDDERFQIGLVIGSPVLTGLDIGYSLDPRTNVGLSFCYLPAGEYNYSSFEPRIKFYSSPKDLSFFWGFGFDIGSYTDSLDPYNNASWLLPNFKFGFGIINSGNLNCEMDWCIGFFIYSDNNGETYTYDQYGYPEYHNSPRTTFYPIGGPGLRIGLAF